MNLNLLLVTILLPLLIYSRDPFRWPEKNKQENTTPITQDTLTNTYRLIGISYNSSTACYTALIADNDTLFFVQTNDLLPNQMLVKSIAPDKVELADKSEQITIAW